MRTPALLAVGVLLAACSTPITADHVGADKVYAWTNENALTRHKPSYSSLLVLHRTGLLERYESDPREALATLHRRAIDLDRRDRLFALAELSLLAARKERDRDLDVAAATYAYLYLLGTAEDPPPNAFDRRFRLACEIYNRGLVEAFRADGGRWVPREGVYELPVGSVTIDVPDDVMHLGAQGFDEFRPAMDYKVRGMAGRLHQSGMGAALIAGAPDAKESAPTEVSAGVMVAGSAFLEVLGDLDAAERPGLRAVLTIHSPQTTDRLVVRGRQVPLELDLTTPLAYTLKESKLWDFELGSFFSPEDVSIENSLKLLSPYRRGRIPVVFVHGTASSPARWAEMINELAADPVLREHYSAWLFIYKTSAPILLSASSLRQSLAEHVTEIDPEGTDEALRRMVVIGHSQGGLLTRLLVTESGDHFWTPLSDRPFEELDVDEEEKDRLRAALFFEPDPRVERVVFISTPHRGSFLSEGLLRTVANWLISIPAKTVRMTRDVVTKNVDFFKPDILASTPTAVDNMAPGARFLVALAAAPMSPHVKRHSIISVTDTTPPLADHDDGVVAYPSAHLDDVDSEKVVLSGHSVQGNPDCILEVRRILREHVRAIEAERAERAEQGESAR